jgi:hypothetical protein
MRMSWRAEGIVGGTVPVCLRGIFIKWAEKSISTHLCYMEYVHDWGWSSQDHRRIRLASP